MAKIDNCLQQGKNLSDMQEMNRSLVLRLLKKNEICSRATLARLSGLNQATITNIISDFIEWGLVKEAGLLTDGKGRRSIGLQINQKEFFVIGVRLMRVKVKIGLFDIFGEVIIEKAFVHGNKDPMAIVDTMKKEINAILFEHKEKEIIVIGIAVPGPYFRNEGKIKSITDFDGWDDLPLKSEMTNAFDIPVIIDHDANAGALAEWWVTPNKKVQGTVVLLTMGEGLGAGIINNGQLFRGILGTAGEVGHTSIDRYGVPCECGNRGCWVKYASTPFMMQEAKRAMPDYPETMLKKGFDFDMLIEAAKQKDALATHVFSEMAKNITVGIINIIWTYGANEIILGKDIFGDATDVLGEPFLNKVRKIVSESTAEAFTEKVTIRLTSLDEDPIFIGSAALAIDYSLRKTSIFATKTSV